MLFGRCMEICPDCTWNVNGGCYLPGYCVHKAQTNEDLIRSLDHEMLKEFLENISHDGAIWYKKFNEEFCKGKCNLPNCTAPKCPYGDPIDWWLKQPLEVEL